MSEKPVPGQLDTSAKQCAGHACWDEWDVEDEAWGLLIL